MFILGSSFFLATQKAAPPLPGWVWPSLSCSHWAGKGSGESHFQAEASGRVSTPSCDGNLEEGLC